jgi:hypothetical protein
MFSIFMGGGGGGEWASFIHLPTSERESSRELAALPSGLCIRLQPLEPGKIIVPSYIAHPAIESLWTAHKVI